MTSQEELPVIIAGAAAVALVSLMAWNINWTPTKAPSETPAAVSSTVQVAAPVAVAAAPAVSKWSYHTNTDKMTGKKWTNAILASTTTETFAWPYKRDASLTLIFQGDTLHINGKGAPGFDCILDCYVNFKIDDGEVISVSASSPRNGEINSIYVTDTKVLSKITTAKKILVGPSFLGDSQNRVFEFDASGFDNSKMIKS